MLRSFFCKFVGIFFFFFAFSMAKLPLNFEYDITLPDSIAGFKNSSFIEPDNYGNYRLFIDEPEYYATYLIKTNEILSYFQKNRQFPVHKFTYGNIYSDTLLDYIEVYIEPEENKRLYKAVFHNYSEDGYEIDSVFLFEKYVIQYVTINFDIVKIFLCDSDGDGIAELFGQYSYIYFDFTLYPQKVYQCFKYEISNDSIYSIDELPLFVRPDYQLPLYSDGIINSIVTNKYSSFGCMPGDICWNATSFALQIYEFDSLLIDKRYEQIVSCYESRHYTSLVFLSAIIVDDIIISSDRYEAILLVTYSAGEMPSPWMTGCSKTAYRMYCYDLSHDTGFVEIWVDSSINAYDYLFIFNDAGFPDAYFGVDRHYVSQYDALTNEFLDKSDSILHGGHEIIAYHPVEVGGQPYLIYKVSNKLKLYSIGNSTDATFTDNQILPDNLILAPPHPNPFNNYVNISFDLIRSGRVKLDIYNILGQNVKNLTDEKYGAGKHEIRWDGSDSRGIKLPSGIYFIRLKSENTERIQKALLMK